MVIAAGACVWSVRSTRKTGKRPPTVEQLMARFREGGMANMDAPMLLVQRGSAAVPALVAEVKGGGSHAARSAELLGEIGDPAAVPGLVEALESGPPPLRAAAAAALGEIAAPAAFEPLLKAVRGGLPEACTSLAALRTGLTEAQMEEAAEALVAATGNEDSALDRAACLALAELGWEDALPVLQSRLASDDHPVWVAEACARLGDEEAVRKLADRLQAEDPKERRAAMESLERIGDVAAPALRRMAASESADARACAARVLGKIGDEGARELLFGLLEDDDPEVIAAAAQAIGALRFPDAAKPLAEAIPRAGDAGYVVAGALASYGEAATPLVINLLRSDDRGTIVAALVAVREGNLTKAGPAVAELLDSSDSEVAQKAATTLGLIGFKSAIPALRKAAQGEDEKVARAARTALLALGGE